MTLALQKLHEKRPEVLYETLVTRWRETFDADLALAAQHVATRLVTPTWAEKKPADRQKKWAAGVKKASTDALVRLELMRNTDFAKDSAPNLVARLEALAKWNPDPVVTKWLVDVFGRQTRAPVLDGQKAFRRVFTALEGCLDHAGAAAFKGWLGTHEARIAATAATTKFFDAGLERVLERSAERLAQAAKLTDAERAALRDAGLLELTKPAAEVDLEALEREVYARPHEDAPRLVLADLLLQQQSPRGEFITLDFVKHRTPEQDRARKALLKAHLKSFVPEGLLAAVRSTTLEFERGFPVRATLKNERQTHPALATVRELDLSSVFAWRTLDEPCFASVEAVVGLLFKVAEGGPDGWAARYRKLALFIEPDGLNVAPLVPLLRRITSTHLEELELDPGDAGRAPWRGSLQRPDVLATCSALVRDLDQQLPSLKRAQLWDAFDYRRDEHGKLKLERARLVPWLHAVVTEGTGLSSSTTPPEVQRGWRALLAPAGVIEATSEVPGLEVTLVKKL